MKPKAAEISVHVQEQDGILLERYTYRAGLVEPLPKHAHEDYQFGLSFDCQGEYDYRGETHHIPTGSLSVIHSGEAHSPSDRTYLPMPATFWMMHIHPTWLQTIVSEMTDTSASLPYFSTAFLTDSTLNRLFLALYKVVNCSVSKLEQDTILWSFLSYLITYYAQTPPAVPSLTSTPAAIVRTREYIHTHYMSDISLNELATIAGLSRFHFCRLFRKAAGLSPSAYQTQLRIDQAKTLLIQGMTIATVASLTGFYDQSHFGAQFKRQVGVTPGQYAQKTATFS